MKYDFVKIFLAKYSEVVLAALLLAAQTASAAAFGSANLLPAEKAFNVSARVTDSRRVEIAFHIAEGYYLYKEKLRVQVAPKSVKAGVLQLPAGQVNEDAFFGRVEIYRDKVAVGLPLDYQGDPPARLSLTVTSQGCADIGVCYPPATKQLIVEMPVTAKDSPLVGDSEMKRMSQEEGKAPQGSGTATSSKRKIQGADADGRAATAQAAIAKAESSTATQAQEPKLVRVDTAIFPAAEKSDPGRKDAAASAAKNILPGSSSTASNTSAGSVREPVISFSAEDASVAKPGSKEGYPC